METTHNHMMSELIKSLLVKAIADYMPMEPWNMFG